MHKTTLWAHVVFDQPTHYSSLVVDQGPSSFSFFSSEVSDQMSIPVSKKCKDKVPPLSDVVYVVSLSVF